MRKEEQAFLDALPEGAGKEQWRKAYGAVYRPRDNPPEPDAPQANPKVWVPPANPPMMPDPRTYPYHNEPLAPRPLTWAEYWQLFARALTVDPVTESANPYRIRLELGTWVPPYNPHPGNPLSGGLCYARRTAATWVEHLRTGDLITVDAYLIGRSLDSPEAAIAMNFTASLGCLVSTCRGVMLARSIG
jgi:hypothetical protein